MSIGRSREFVAEALLFDLDGVLVDSSAAVTKVWSTWAAEKGLDFEPLFALAQGRRQTDVILEILPGAAIQSELAYMHGLEMQALDSIVEIPGARQLLTSLQSVRWAVVTSGSRQTSRARLRTLGLPIPAQLVAAEDVDRGKPDPEPYMKASQLLGVPPARCVVFEDAPAGIESAHRTGARVIGLATTFPAEVLSAADAVVDDFRSLHWQERDGWIRLLL